MRLDVASLILSLCSVFLLEDAQGLKLPAFNVGGLLMPQQGEGRSSPVVDLRSDTVTRPSKAMRTAMFEAEVGDDVFGDDPTTNLLEDRVREMFDKEAALFFPSGTMANLAATMSWCQHRGSEMLLGDSSHMFLYEQAGASQLAGVSPRTVPNKRDGTINVDALENALRADNIHFPRTAMIAIENTHNYCGGRVLPDGYTEALGWMAQSHGIPLHIDGARIWNAATASKQSVSQLTKHADSVSTCLSKGLGAPAGSLLVGPRAFIARARRARKVLGGGMRQVGILAAAGIQALDDFETGMLEADHSKAKVLAKALSEMPGFAVDIDGVETNMILVHIDDDSPLNPSAIVSLLKEKGVLVLPFGSKTIRVVTHRDISNDEILFAIEVFRSVATGMWPRPSAKGEGKAPEATRSIDGGGVGDSGTTIITIGSASKSTSSTLSSPQVVFTTTAEVLGEAPSTPSSSPLTKTSKLSAEATKFLSPLLSSLADKVLTDGSTLTSQISSTVRLQGAVSGDAEVEVPSVWEQEELAGKEFGETYLAGAELGGEEAMVSGQSAIVIGDEVDEVIGPAVALGTPASIAAQESEDFYEETVVHGMSVSDEGFCVFLRGVVCDRVLKVLVTPSDPMADGLDRDQVETPEAVTLLQLLQGIDVESHLSRDALANKFAEAQALREATLLANELAAKAESAAEKDAEAAALVSTSSSTSFSSSSSSSSGGGSVSKTEGDVQQASSNTNKPVDIGQNIAEAFEWVEGLKQSLSMAAPVAAQPLSSSSSSSPPSSPPVSSSSSTTSDTSSSPPSFPSPPSPPSLSSVIADIGSSSSQPFASARSASVGTASDVSSSSSISARQQLVLRRVMIAATEAKSFDAKLCGSWKRYSLDGSKHVLPLADLVRPSFFPSTLSTSSSLTSSSADAAAATVPVSGNNNAVANAPTLVSSSDEITTTGSNGAPTSTSLFPAIGPKDLQFPQPGDICLSVNSAFEAIALALRHSAVIEVRSSLLQDENVSFKIDDVKVLYPKLLEAEQNLNDKLKFAEDFDSRNEAERLQRQLFEALRQGNPIKVESIKRQLEFYSNLEGQSVLLPPSVSGSSQS